MADAEPQWRRIMKSVEHDNYEPMYATAVICEGERNRVYCDTDRLTDEQKWEASWSFQSEGGEGMSFEQFSGSTRALCRLLIGVPGELEVGALGAVYRRVCDFLASDFKLASDDLRAICLNDTHLLFPRQICSAGVRYAIQRLLQEAVADVAVAVEQQHTPMPFVITGVMDGDEIIDGGIEVVFDAFDGEEALFLDPNEAQWAEIIESGGVDGYVRFDLDLDGQPFTAEAIAREIDKGGLILLALDAELPGGTRILMAHPHEAIVEAAGGSYQRWVCTRREKRRRIDGGIFNVFNARGGFVGTQFACCMFASAGVEVVMPWMRAIVPPPFPNICSDASLNGLLCDFNLQTRFSYRGHVRVPGRCGFAVLPSSDEEASAALHALLPHGCFLTQKGFSQRLVVRFSLQGVARDTFAEIAVRICRAMVKNLFGGETSLLKVRGDRRPQPPRYAYVDGADDSLWIVFDIVYDDSLTPNIRLAIQHYMSTHPLKKKYWSASVTQEWPLCETTLYWPATFRQAASAAEPHLDACDYDLLTHMALADPTPRLWAHWLLSEAVGHRVPFVEKASHRFVVLDDAGTLIYHAPKGKKAVLFRSEDDVGVLLENFSETTARVTAAYRRGERVFATMSGRYLRRIDGREEVDCMPRPPAEQILGVHGMCMQVDSRTGEMQLPSTWFMSSFRRDLCYIASDYEAVTCSFSEPEFRLPPVTVAHYSGVEALEPRSWNAMQREWTLLKAAMGAGKTHRVTEFIKSLSPATHRCIYGTGRRILLDQTFRTVCAASADRRYERYDKPFSRETLDDVPCIFTTIHSLHKFVGHGAQYYFDLSRPRDFVYVLILDEICGVMLGDYQSQYVIEPAVVEATLHQLLGFLCKQLVVLDAYLSAAIVDNLLKRAREGVRMMDVTRAAFADPPIHLTVHEATCNLVEQQRRRADFFCGATARDSMLLRVERELEAGGNVALFFSSVMMARACETQLKTAGYDGDAMVVFTSRERPRWEEGETLGESMQRKRVRVFIYTTAAGNGVDVSFFGEIAGVHEEYFTMMALFGLSSSHLSFLDVVQASGRVRCCRRVLLELSEPPPPPLCLSHASDDQYGKLMKASKRTLVAMAAERVRGEERMRQATNQAYMASFLYNWMNNVNEPPDDTAYTELLALGSLHGMVQRVRPAFLVSIFLEMGYEAFCHRVSEFAAEELKRKRSEMELSSLVAVDEELLPSREGAEDEAVAAAAELRDVCAQLGLETSFLDGPDVSEAEKIFARRLASRHTNVFHILSVVDYLNSEQPASRDEWYACLRVVAAQFSSSAQVEEAAAELARQSQGAVRQTSHYMLRGMAGGKSTIIIAGVALYSMAAAIGLLAPGADLFSLPKSLKAAEVDSDAETLDLFALMNRGQVAMRRVGDVVKDIFVASSNRSSVFFTEADQRRRRKKNAAAAFAIGAKSMLGVSMKNGRGTIHVEADSEMGMLLSFYSHSYVRRQRQWTSQWLDDDTMFERRERLQCHLWARAALHNMRDMDAEERAVQRVPGESYLMRRRKKGVLNSRAAAPPLQNAGNA